METEDKKQILPLGLALGFMQNKNLLPSQKLILMTLMHMSHESGEEWVTISAYGLGESIGASSRSVQGQIYKMLRKNLLAKKNNKTVEGFIAPNSYLLVGWWEYYNEFLKRSAELQETE